MKSAYELAMERLNQTAPMKKATEAQKKQLAELDSVYGAKIAEREITVREEIQRLEWQGDAEGVEKLRQQWAEEKRKLQAELEEKKDRIRQG